jgi:SHS2 domain-containing protein
VSSPGYQFFDHTGDFGVEVRAETPEEAVEEAARALLDLLTGAPETVREQESRALLVEGLDAAETLVALGNELLFLFETEGFLCARLELDEVAEDAFEGVAHGERFDPDRHPIARPIKAVTHHGAELSPTGDGWRIRLIFDL